MPMKTVTIKQVPDTLHQRLRRRAKTNHRSLNGELLAILEVAAAGSDETSGRRGSISDFLLASPLPGSGLELKRSADTGREVEL